jgi:hypothetical protein
LFRNSSDRRHVNDVFKIAKHFFYNSFSFCTTANGADSRRWGYYKYFYNLKKGRQTLTAVENAVSG